MANVYVKCRGCRQMWPSTGGGVVDHKHLSSEELKRQLKAKHRSAKRGRSVAATPRTNSPKGKSKTVGARRRAYGPW